MRIHSTLVIQHKLILLQFVFSKKATKFDRIFTVDLTLTTYHGRRTPNEGINQRYLKNWADVADKICCRHT